MPPATIPALMRCPILRTVATHKGAIFYFAALMRAIKLFAQTMASSTVGSTGSDPLVERA